MACGAVLSAAEAHIKGITRTEPQRLIARTSPPPSAAAQARAQAQDRPNRPRNLQQFATHGVRLANRRNVTPLKSEQRPHQHSVPNAHLSGPAPPPACSLLLALGAPGPPYWSRSGLGPAAGSPGLGPHPRGTGRAASIEPPLEPAEGPMRGHRQPPKAMAHSDDDESVRKGVGCCASWLAGTR